MEHRLALPKLARRSRVTLYTSKLEGKGKGREGKGRERGKGKKKERREKRKAGEESKREKREGRKGNEDLQFIFLIPIYILRMPIYSPDTNLRP